MNDENKAALEKMCKLVAEHGMDGVRWRARIDEKNWVVGRRYWKLITKGIPSFDDEQLYEFESIPRALIIPRAEVPMPMSVEPAIGAHYWAIFTGSVIEIQSICWGGDPMDKRLFASRNCYATEADARANMDAMTRRETK